MPFHKLRAETVCIHSYITDIQIDILWHTLKMLKTIEFYPNFLKHCFRTTLKDSVQF